MAARNMWRIEINIQEKIVRQFGYLQGIVGSILWPVFPGFAIKGQVMYVCIQPSFLQQFCYGL